MADPAFDTKTVPAEVDVLAPDGSEIRLLGTLPGGSLVHCALPAGRVSLTVTHRTVEEFWFILAGRGQVWRKQGEREEVTEVEPGMALTIPLGTHFQFRSERDAPLDFVIVTMPAWPGNHEAVRVRDHWPVDET